MNPSTSRMPGWKTSTKGVTRLEELPDNARKYLRDSKSLSAYP